MLSGFTDIFKENLNYWSSPAKPPQQMDVIVACCEWGPKMLQGFSCLPWFSAGLCRADVSGQAQPAAGRKSKSSGSALPPAGHLKHQLGELGHLLTCG